MKKQLLLLMMMLLPMVASADNSGTCGDNVHYFYDTSTKTLTISGEGKMTNYPGYHMSPWDSFVGEILYLNIEDGVTSIGDYAFSCCSSIISTSIPSSVTSIGKYSFAEAGNLKEINLPNSINSIGQAAFMCCSALKSFTIPSSVSVIELSTFSGCTSLSSIGIPANITKIDQSSFYGCSSLVSISIPDDVESIGQMAFGGCTGLITLNLGNNIKYIFDNAFQKCDALYKVSIGSVSYIGSNVFSGCPNLAEVHIGDIGAWCTTTFFDNPLWRAHNLFINGEKVKDLVIPEGVTSINDGAFHQCNSISAVYFPKSLEKIEMSAFQMCEGLNSVHFEDGLKFLDTRVFDRCYNLTNVYVKDLSSWFNINIPYPDVFTTPYHFFLGESEISDLIIPSEVQSIGSYLFNNCISINSVTVPDGVTNIDKYAFQNCTNLSIISMGDGIINIGDYAFNGCSKLSSISFSNSLIEIGEGAFSCCSVLKILNLPQSLKSIRKQAFYGCGIEELTIPSAVEYIYPESFAVCYSLAKVVTQATVPPFLYDNSFSNFSVPLKVPKGCKETYQTAQGWKNFTNISDADKYKLTYTVDNEEYKSYEIEEGATITPEPTPTKEGYTFSGWSKIPETMPAHDVTISGTFSINKYKLTYTVDGEEYKTYEVEYGATITPEPTPTKEGYTFSGWSKIPETMPAKDVTITGTFSINSYKLTYMIDDEVYKEVTYEYGANITPEPQPEGNYDTFEWTDLPKTMPAHDVVVHATYTSGIKEILMSNQQDVKIYAPNGKMLTKPQKGINIIRMKDGTTKKVVVK